MEGANGAVHSAKTPEEIAEEKLRAKYPNIGVQSQLILQKRLNKNVKYFDSGDYNMAKARCNSSQKAGMLKAQTASAIPELPVDVIAAQQTGDTIPTPDNVPAVRKKAVELQHELQHQGQSATPAVGLTTVNTTAAASVAPPTSPSSRSPTRPAAESHFVHLPSVLDK
nr:camp regulated phosphoprotein [Hymenolepis microstoma]